MPTAPNGAEIFIGAGKVYFDRFDVNGNSTGKRFLGNCPKFEITPSVDSSDVWNYTKKVRTKLAKINKTQTHTIAIDTQEFQPKNVALALFGTDTLYTQTGGAITAELLASVASPTSTVASIPTAAGGVFKTAQRNISATTLKATTSTTPTTLALGTDYEIEDAVSGLIRILTIANFPGGITGLTLDYTAAAMTTSANKTMITAAATPTIYGAIYFVGDPLQGRAIDVEIWRAELATSAALALIGDDTGTISLTGEILDDSLNHASQPFYRTIER